jgi:hypothetical protein
VSINALYNWLYVASCLVIIGVFLEVAEYIEDFKKEGWRRPGTWQQRLFKRTLAIPDAYLKWAPKLGLSILVIGLAGELFFQTLIGSKETLFRTDASHRIAEAAQEYNDLRIAVEQRMVAMRGGGPADTRLAFAPFKGIPVWIQVVPDDSEANQFAESIKELLQMGSLRPKLVTERETQIPGDHFTSVFIWTFGKWPPSPRTKAMDAAETLRRLLDQRVVNGPIGLDPYVTSPKMLPATFPPDGIYVQVGIKTPVDVLLMVIKGRRAKAIAEAEHERAVSGLP